MKKRILAISLIVAMLAVAVIGGSLAFFTDSDKAVNTFTVGNVKIELNEYNREKEPFTQDQFLKPGDSKNNAIPKNVTVTNTGSEAAYVWVEILVPKALYLDDETNETYNGLHFNQFKDYLYGYTGRSSNPNAVAQAGIYAEDHQWTVAEYIGDREGYAVLRTIHMGIVAPRAETVPAMSQVYMDWRVHTDENGVYQVATKADGSEYGPYTGPWEIKVEAYAIQAEGIDSAEKAVWLFENPSKSIADANAKFPGKP